MIVFLLFLSGLTTGCSDATPPVVPANGIVNLRGRPLANAEVRFVPMAPGLDGNFVASGVTDQDGGFTLSLQGKNGQGCCACRCKVLVGEAPLPKEVRDAYISNDQKVINRFQKSLKNRPIPKRYSALKSTPLSFAVSKERSQYNIELQR
jgi:hypothetical protein